MKKTTTIISADACTPVPKPAHTVTRVGMLSIAEDEGGGTWRVESWDLGGWGSQVHIESRLLHRLIQAESRHRAIAYTTGEGGIWVGSTDKGQTSGITCHLSIALDLCAIGMPLRVAEVMLKAVADDTQVGEVTTAMARIYEDAEGAEKLNEELRAKVGEP